MIALLISSFTSTLFSFLGRVLSYRVSLKISWLIFFIFLSLRFNYGNDYLGYLYFYLNADYSDQFIPGDYDFKGLEIGWSFASWIFHFFGTQGFILMVAFFSGINCFVFYRFVKVYVPQSYYWFVVLFYSLNYEMLLIMSSAMRQSVALSIFLFSFDYLKSREFFKYSFLIFLSSLFHTSALFLILLYFIPLIKFKINEYSLFFPLTSFILVLFFSDGISKLLFSFTDGNFDFYGVYESGEYEERSIGLGLLTNIAIYAILYLRSLRSKNIIINNINSKIILILMFLYPFGIVNPMINRINYYLIPVTLLSFSNVFEEWKNKTFKNLFIIFVLVFTAYTFYLFHTSSVYAKYYANYKTVFQFVSDVDLKDIIQ